MARFEQSAASEDTDESTMLHKAGKGGISSSISHQAVSNWYSGSMKTRRTVVRHFRPDYVGYTRVGKNVFAWSCEGPQKKFFIGH